jgi:predicted ABC-type transport system involved in lysophospholipase L1 biosynthesis ATPase subunit
VTTTAADTRLAVCRSATVVYGRGDAAVTALAEVDLAIAAGERLALAGRSGSGKTTLLHVLGGLVVPTSGDVLLAGKPLSSLDAAARGEARAHAVAYVFQGANLLPTFTAFENIAFAAHVSQARDGQGIPPAALLELVGLTAKLDALPSELSGGEAQRVAIARALAQRPALLLCDEPTGQLDTDTGSRVLDLIEALQQRFGFALVIATHDPQVAARCERIVTLEDGRAVSDEELEP